MNIVHINEAIADLIGRVPREIPYPMVAGQLPTDAAALRSPLLTIPDQTEDDVLMHSTEAEGWVWGRMGHVSTPFPQFRFSFKMRASAGSEPHVTFGVCRVIQIVKPDRSAAPDHSKVGLMWLMGADAAPMSLGFVTSGLNFAFQLQHGKWERVSKELAAGMRAVVNGFLWYYLMPSFQVVEVMPAIRGGKSVEWQRVRSHFTVVHRRHSANRREVVEGSVVAEGVITRVAHSRRAHFRMLRAERFKEKRGQRVPVRATWVGPKEWQDSTGQIYRVFEPKGKAA